MTCEELRSQIKNAMRDHDRDRLSALRQVLQAVRQVEVDERRDATEADVSAATKRLIRICTEEADALGAEPDNHKKRIDMLRSQIETLQSLLPEQVEGDALDEVIESAIRETEASSMRDMGKVMAVVREKTNGECDMKVASAKVRSLLGKG